MLRGRFYQTFGRHVLRRYCRHRLSAR